LDDDFPLLDDEGSEIPIYDFDGNRIPRRSPIVDPDQPSCGVLMDLTNIQALFNPVADFSDMSESDTYTTAADLGSPHVDVNVYPLAFLRTAGNVQAHGIPHCFYPILTDINCSVGKQQPPPNRHGFRGDEDGFTMVNANEDEDDFMVVDDDRDDSHPASLRVVKPIFTQFYNYFAHRVAPRAGGHESQHGGITAAISGAFATSQKHKRAALKKQSECERSLPFQRFHDRISIEDCPTCCRAELVYSIDIRGLKNPSGTYASFFHL
jgi:hypothetical protein